MKITYALCVVSTLSLALFSCKRELQESNHNGKNPPARATGFLSVAPESYRTLINHERLQAGNLRAPCSSIDLTALFPTPGDQGLQGSCVSWAVGYAAKSYWERNEIGWPLTTNHLFSPQYIYSQTHVNNSSGGGGSFFPDALNLVMNKGVSTLDITPYDLNNPFGFQTQPTDPMHMQAFRFRNSGWSALPFRDVEAIRVRLCNGEPVMLGIPVFPDFDDLWFGNDTYDNLNGTSRGGHAITLIGFDDTRQAFRFINQWGTFWGLNGYGWISYDLISNNNFEAYVMFDKPNLPLSDTWVSTSAAGIGTLGYYSGDFNGDGNTDVIHPWNNNGTLAIIAHDISSSSTSILCNNTMSGSGTGNVGFIPADVNGDGKTDLVQGWRNGNSLYLSMFTSNGSAFVPAGTVGTSNGYQNLRLLPVDMDGDGKTDIAQLWNNGGRLGIIIYRSTGSTYTQTYSTTLSNGSGNVGFIPADYDGDGKTDIIQCWSNGGYLAIDVIRSTGTSYYSAWAGTMAAGASNVGLAPLDYNGDGKMDFVQGWNNGGKLNLLLYQSNGSGYGLLPNIDTRHGSGNLGLVFAKRAGVNKSGFVQVFNNSNSTAFIRYEPLNY